MYNNLQPTCILNQDHMGTQVLTVPELLYFVTFRLVTIYLIYIYICVYVDKTKFVEMLNSINVINSILVSHEIDHEVAGFCRILTNFTWFKLDHTRVITQTSKVLDGVGLMRTGGINNR